MNAISRGSMYAAAILATALWASAADSAPVRGGDVSAMGNWYGRAGGLAGSDLVSKPATPEPDQQSVKVTYDKTIIDYTYLPRGQLHEGPVADSYGPADKRAPEMFGRAGDAAPLEQMQSSPAQG